MGRYYSTANNDFDGKFWFGVQPSDDPERVFGMKPTGGDESYTDYYLDDNDSQSVMNELDKQFSKMGVPQDKRRYRFENADEVAAYVWDELYEYYLTEKVTKDIHGQPNIPWAVGDKTMYPKSTDKVLAASRVSLGLRILNDLRKHGECQLNAEF